MRPNKAPDNPPPEHDHERRHRRPHFERIAWADMNWRDYVRIGFGMFFFVFGLVGLVLPVLQGILFLIVSAILLAPYSVWVQKQQAWFEKRYPWIARQAHRFTARRGHVKSDD